MISRQQFDEYRRCQCLGVFNMLDYNSWKHYTTLTKNEWFEIIKEYDTYYDLFHTTPDEKYFEEYSNLHDYLFNIIKRIFDYILLNYPHKLKYKEHSKYINFIVDRIDKHVGIVYTTNDSDETAIFYIPYITICNKNWDEYIKSK